MKAPILPVLVVSLCLAFVGCNKKDGGSGGGATSTATSAVTPARETSFAEVTSQLDPGGSVYGYLATDQWLAGLSTKISGFRDLLLNLPDVSAKDREGIDKVFDLLTKAVSRSGVENLTGVGVSGLQLTPELHRTKIILHHKQSEGDGLLWNLLGKTPHALTGLDLLTTNTVIATFGDVDIPALWAAIESGLGNAGVPELSEGIQQWPVEFEKHTKISWSQMLASLGGEAGMVLTLDATRKISLPIGKGLEIPEPGLLLAVKVKSDLLFEHISSSMKQNGNVESTDEKGLKMYAMPVPVPLPMELKVTVASSGDYFFVATSPELVRNALAVRAGTRPGLRTAADVQAMLPHLPAQGNQFTYMGRRFSEMILASQKQVLASGNQMPLELFEKLFLRYGVNYGLSIGAHTPTGWVTTSVGTQDSATAVIGAAAVAPMGLLAAIAIPNFVKARETAQQNACINNLRQIDAAKLQWALENNKQDGAVPTESQIAIYIKGQRLPTCPKGGHYVIGKVGNAPTCSEPGHKLPR